MRVDEVLAQSCESGRGFPACAEVKGWGWGVQPNTPTSLGVGTLMPIWLFPAEEGQQGVGEMGVSGLEQEVWLQNIPQETSQIQSWRK